MTAPGREPPHLPSPRAVSTASARLEPTAWCESDIEDLLKKAQDEVRRGEKVREWQDALITATHERMVALVGRLMGRRTHRQKLANRCRDVVSHVFLSDLPGWLRSDKVTSLTRNGFCAMFEQRAHWRLNELYKALSRDRDLVGVGTDEAWFDELNDDERCEAAQLVEHAGAVIGEIERLDDEDRLIAQDHLIFGRSLASIARERCVSPDSVERTMARIKMRLEHADEGRAA